ncbi:MAG: SUMF1/EgtB/PvdO family nonheme iron enzyme [Chloroflexota bacterium]
MSKIFISYRRADSRLVTYRIYDRLHDEFGKNNVFKDIDNIPPGEDFRGVLREATTNCQVMLVIIGSRWIDARDDDGNRRLDNTDDFVRLEIEAGLQQSSTQVIPVLVEGAHMPSANELPETIKDLAYRNAFVVDSDRKFRADVDSLIKAVHNNISIRKQTRSIDWRWLVGVVLIPIIAAIIGGLIQNPEFFGLSNSEDATEVPLDYIATATNNRNATSTQQIISTLFATQTEIVLQRTVNALGTQNAELFATETASASSINSSTTPVDDDFTTLRVSDNSEWVVVERTINNVMMVLVPSGCFNMGSLEFSDAQPVDEICFDQPFWIDRFEVSNSQFSEFSGTSSQESFNLGSNHPREQVSWDEARLFCLSREARLPTEAEWEYAARGPDGNIYPWGNSFLSNGANGVHNSLGGTTEIGNYPSGASWVGAEDMSGNVWEWTHTIYDLYGSNNIYPYPYATDDGRENLRENVLRSLRGGSFLSDSTILMSNNRFSRDENLRDNEIGFRCVSDWQDD